MSNNDPFVNAGTFNSTHRTLPMDAQWKRYLFDPEARALLAGFRIAPEVFGAIFEALEYAASVCND